MSRSRESMLANVLLIGVALVSLIVFVVDRQMVNTYYPPQQIMIDQSQVMTVSIGGANPIQYTVDQTETINALALLTKLQAENGSFSFETEDFAAGKFVTTINGLAADKAKEFWEIKVNGKPAEVGISELNINKGDQLEFNLVGFN